MCDPILMIDTKKDCEDLNNILESDIKKLNDYVIDLHNNFNEARRLLRRYAGSDAEVRNFLSRIKK